MRTALKTIGITRFCAFVIFVLAALCDTAMAQSVTLTVSPTTLTFTNVAANTISSSQTVSVSANVTTSATVQISSGSPWLDVSPLALPTVGTSGQNLTVRVKAQGLTQGTYQGFFTIAIAGSSANQVTVNVSATVVGNSVFSASPSSLAFSAQQGATTSVPATTNVRISSTGPALNYTIGGTTQSGGNWLTLSATAGAVGDSGFNVSANPTGLAPGLYLGSITIQSATTADSLTITVSLTVVGNVSVSVTPAQPAPFLFQTGVTATNSPALTQTLSVSATGGSTTFTVALSPPVTWLVLSPLNGTVGSLPATLTLTATPQGLAPGTYTTSVVVTPQNGTALTPVPISLIVSNNSLIQLATGTVTFVAGFGSASPTDQTVALTSFGSGSSIPFTAGSDSSWLTVSPTAGTVPAILTLHINQAGLNTGTYTGRITVRPTNGDTYSETILVNLTVSNTASISVTPPIVYFSYQPSQGQPSAQTFQVVAPGGAAVPITVSTLTTTCGSNWITASSSSGATPASVSVSITTTGMNPGICSGSVLIRYDSGLGLTNATVPVTVAVSNNSELAISLPAGFGVESVA